MPVSKNTRRRYILIDSLLKGPRHYTIKEIAKKVNEQLEEDGFQPVSLKMYYNDIKNIENEYPVSILKGIGGTIHYENSYDSITNEILRQEDRAIVEMALQAFSIYKGSGLFDKFDDVITRMMAGTVLRGIDKSGHEKYIQIGEAIGETGQKWLEIIYEAIVGFKCLKIHYKPYDKEVKVRIISPCLLKEYRNTWYMLAHFKDRDNNVTTNVFKLTRIQKIEPSPEVYMIDNSFSKDDYFKYSLGVFHLHSQGPIEVKLKFNKNLITLVSEQKIHSSMVVLSKTADEMIVSFKVYNTIELKNMILGYGADVEVLEPETLRAEIKNSLIESLNKYTL